MLTQSDQLSGGGSSLETSHKTFYVNIDGYL